MKIDTLFSNFRRGIAVNNFAKFMYKVKAVDLYLEYTKQLIDIQPFGNNIISKEMGLVFFLIFLFVLRMFQGLFKNLKLACLYSSKLIKYCLKKKKSLKSNLLINSLILSFNDLSLFGDFNKLDLLYANTNNKSLIYKNE